MGCDGCYKWSETPLYLSFQTNCLVVAISPDLDLSKGHVSNLISEACGEKLQQELSTKCQHKIFRGELFAVDSFNLSKQGVKKLIFVSLPFWKRNKDLDHVSKKQCHWYSYNCISDTNSIKCVSYNIFVFDFDIKYLVVHL